MSGNRYPELADLDAEDINKLLKRSRLSKEDRKIATSCLVKEMDYIEVGAAVHMDRTTVSRRMRWNIVPHLMQLQRKEKKAKKVS